MIDFLSQLTPQLSQKPLHWLVTGAAGFIGSHLVETLLRLGQRVTGIDNLSTGKLENIRLIESVLTPSGMERFRFIEGDICDPTACETSMADVPVDVILHQAALGSVPRSINSPASSVRSNVLGFTQVVESAREFGVGRIVYASSSSVYGNDTNSVKREGIEGLMQSPYAVTKRSDELLAAVFANLYDMTIIGLRYFNVFGPRQDPDGPYAAVIPRWLGFMLRGESCPIYGDGSTTRDFSFVQNIVEANLQAALVAPETLPGRHNVFNIGCGSTTNLNQLHAYLQEFIQQHRPNYSPKAPTYLEGRPGDLPHSLASIERAQSLLGYQGRHSVCQGLSETVNWFLSHYSER